jgi:hypothetical protein
MRSFFLYQEISIVADKNMVICNFYRGLSFYNKKLNGKINAMLSVISYYTEYGEGSKKSQDN